MFKILCFEYKIVSIEYFMDKMPEYELIDILDNIPFIDVSGWEQTRSTIFTMAQMMSKKQLKSTDLFVFPWDEEFESHKSRDKSQDEPLPQEISDTDIARLKAKAAQFEGHKS